MGMGFLDLKRQIQWPRMERSQWSFCRHQNIHKLQQTLFGDDPNTDKMAEHEQKKNMFALQ